MGYKVLDILKELPGTNCRDCGKASCFAFATGVYLDGLPLSGCVHLSPEKLADMERKLREARGAGEGKKEASHVQALNFLLGKVREMSFSRMAENSGAEYRPGPPETLSVSFLGQEHLITADEITAPEGEPPSVWVKVFLYIYVTRANCAPPQGKWVAYRELPNTVSKTKTFEKTVSEIGEKLGTAPDELERAAVRLGGVPYSFGSADGVWLFKALPRVEILLLYWKGGEEFEPRTTLLLDGGILDYLDQEAIVFLAEAFVKRMTGGKVAEVIP